MQYNCLMKLAYQFKLLPTSDQRRRMSKWLDMLRHQYNFLLADRFDWFEMNRCSVNACPLVCSIASPREHPEYYGQKRSLVSLKTEREWYKDIHADVLQYVTWRFRANWEGEQRLLLLYLLGLSQFSKNRSASRSSLSRDRNTSEQDACTPKKRS